MDNPPSHPHLPADSTSPFGGSSEAEHSPVAKNDQEPPVEAFSIPPLDLSDRQTLQDIVRKEAKRIPDIRQDRIKRIRAALESREYPISSDLLADRIIQDMLSDESNKEE